MTNLDIRNNLYNDCKQKEIPFVILKKNGKKCTIDYDMFTCNFDLNERGLKEMGDILNRVIMFKGFNFKGSSMSFGSSYGYLSKIPIEFGDICYKTITSIVNDKRFLISIEEKARIKNDKNQKYLSSFLQLESQHLTVNGKDDRRFSQ